MTSQVSALNSDWPDLLSLATLSEGDRWSDESYDKISGQHVELIRLRAKTTTGDRLLGRSVRIRLRYGSVLGQ